MTDKRTLTSHRIQMGGLWYLSSERAAKMINVEATSVAAREDFRQQGHYMIYDGVHFYSEIYCQELAALDVSARGSSGDFIDQYRSMPND